MPTARRESSADSAARFLALHGDSRDRRSGRRPTARVDDPATHLLRWMAQVDQLERCAPPERAVVDFNRATLRAIHKVLCDAMAPREHRPEHYTGELLNLIVIAEQMVGRALGYPDCDDPPLTDREALP